MHPALSIIAHMGRTDIASVRPELSLATLKISKSLGLGMLRSALERQSGRKLPPLTSSMTVQDVLNLVDGQAGVKIPPPNDRGPGKPSAMPAPAAPTNRAALFPPIGHGVDIQEISVLPEIPDEWEHQPFYARHFTADEMATARTRPDPRAHLAGIWCAKEAVKKSDPKLIRLEFTDIAIEHDSANRPAARLLPLGLQERYEVIVSISHSGAYAFGSAITHSR